MPQDGHAHLQQDSTSLLSCFSSSSSLPTRASPLPELFYPYLLPSFIYTVTQAAFPLLFLRASPIPSQPMSIPSILQALALQPLLQGDQPPCSTALLSLKQIQCILLLLEAAVRGETFQYAQQSLWGI